MKKGHFSWHGIISLLRAAWTSARTDCRDGITLKCWAIKLEVEVRTCTNTLTSVIWWQTDEAFAELIHELARIPFQYFYIRKFSACSIASVVKECIAEIPSFRPFCQVLFCAIVFSEATTTPDWKGNWGIVSFLANLTLTSRVCQVQARVVVALSRWRHVSNFGHKLLTSAWDTSDT